MRVDDRHCRIQTASRLTVYPAKYIHCRVKTKVFKSGNSLAVRLPKALELPCGTVSIHREGRKIIIEEVTENGWPEGFFQSVRISRKDFAREKSTYVEKVL